ncbi:hypothetical protein C8J95_11211 [Elizabethkingia sp. YR214]|uniref:primase-helicase family protein n=1 Tax=Elizabethkingia sp. YR214 TaxID=2135667 RepID=UPI000D31DF4B|nr:primase-helicase family protein [Elizabethkingia sp. YR214]PUB25848.1 hypothetical protein C8J95_11211 [Elizabethkingia sp. YR214]
MKIEEQGTIPASVEKENQAKSTLIIQNNSQNNSTSTAIIPEQNFYSISYNGNQVHIEFKIAKVLKFLESLGFRRLRMPNGGYELVRIHKNSILINSDQEDMMEAIKYQLLEIDQQPEVWEQFLEGIYLTSKLDTAMQRISEVKLNTATKDISYFFFINGVVEVTKNQIRLIPYEEYSGYIFREQIIQHNIDLRDLQSEETAMFDTFLQNATNNNSERYNYLTSTIGYLLHSYKDPSLTKAVILVDEEIDYEGGAQGGTGKTLISDALKTMINSVVKDGRTLTTKSNRFFYQDISLGSRLMIIDDISSETLFETFFSVITGGMVVEKKGKQSFTIPFELSPKLLITTNYMLSGSGGNSEERRKIEIEIAPYYRGRSIRDEFGCTFFSEWTPNQWNLFYITMLKYCQKFLKYGIQYSPPINLIENKLISETDISFVEFMDSNVKFTGDSYEYREEKIKLFQAYKALHTLETRSLTINMFRKWCDKYATAREYKIYHQKSNSKSYLILSSSTDKSLKCQSATK